MSSFPIWLVMLAVLVSIYPQSESLSNDDKEKINLGLEVGQGIAELLENKQFTSSLTKIGKSIGPYLGALGPFIGIVLAFIPSESAELQFMKNMMKQIDNRFDRLDSRFNDVERMINWNAVKVNFGQIEQKILAMAKEYEFIYEVPKSAAANRKTIFMSNYESDYQNSGTKLYQAIIYQQGTFQENLGTSVMRYTKNDRKQTQGFLLGVMQLLLQAVKIELAYLQVQQFDKNAEFMKSEWEKRIQQVKSNFEQTDRNVRDKYHDQSGIDTVEYAGHNSGMNNQQFASGLFNMLAGKYYWRNWIVVIYNDIWGGDNHWVQVCGGHIKFRQNGRNILIASRDNNYPIMDLARAERDMKNVAMTSRHGNWWTGYYNKRREAKDIYNSLNKQGACNVGVIKCGENLWYHYHTKRFKYVNRCPHFNLNMWG